MSTERGPRGNGQGLLIGAAAVLVLVVAAGMWAPVALTDAPGYTGQGLFDTAFAVARGQIRWTLGCTIAAAAELLLLVLLAVGVGWVWKRRGHRGSRVDAKARHMAGRQELEHLSPRGVQASAARLRPSLADAKTIAPDDAGVLIGHQLAGGMPLRQSWEDMAVDIWGPRTGKALAAWTPVLTPHGWTPIKELARGCRVIGSDGRPTTVTGVYPQGVRPAYRMHFSDGASVLCDPDHLWTVRPKRRVDKKNPEAWRTWTTHQLLANGLHRASGGARYYLPVVAPVAFEGVLPEGRLPDPPVLVNVARRGPQIRPVPTPTSRPVAPYLLGVLLGDGGLSAGQVRLSTAEALDLLPLLQPLLPVDVTAKPVKGSRYHWALTAPRGVRNQLMAGLRELGVMSCRSTTKFVPPAYLLADVATRTAVLQGLLDTDGSIDRAGVVDYSTSSPQLADDVRFLVQSLGGLVTTRRRETTHAPSYRLHLRLPLAVQPFRLPRKQQRWSDVAPQRRSHQPVRTITAIEPEGEAEMVCISVAASDGLFVVDDFVVTHNTTARAIPAIVASPGPVLVTSVKGDIVDATRGPREARGPVAVFDPQGLWSEPQRMWVNLLRPILTITDARRLAEHFAAAERAPGVQRDAFFDPKGEDLTASLLLAAAAGGLPITDAYKWATNPRDDTPVRLLRQHGHELAAYAVEGVINLPDKTRGGIYGGAELALSCLTEPAVAAWVTPPTAPSIVEFDPAAFVTGAGALYLLSQGGPGSPAPLVAALTDAVLRAGEARARTSRGRRLDPPLLSVLDEAANICRMRQLPALYSFYGSMGLPIITILQSYAQGVDVWGREGMRKLWSAANVRTYGGGVADPDFLEELSKLIGEHDVTVRSTTHNGMSLSADSVSRSTRRERILDVAALHALRRGRMIVYSSGARPVLARTAPWQHGPYAAAIRASIERFDPDHKVEWTLTPGPGDPGNGITDSPPR
ncbi:TraM recognition domain-containing protein [Couchioplanes caeruleus]|uniref:LAGLIDADG DNA endonuclease family protein n=1 Tax=Couchioplanes caeruleus TaxID=56438 RepID=A0A3N1FTC4_9ACTN|nr:TraM recognition domain-containing protein [Couchioplanes caeruleus]ROP21242.1 LAGLIDADG DNA endonuclease family protein [Couchioplanes caeruleus]